MTELNRPLRRKSETPGRPSRAMYRFNYAFCGYRTYALQMLPDTATRQACISFAPLKSLPALPSTRDTPVSCSGRNTLYTGPGTLCTDCTGRCVLFLSFSASYLESAGPWLKTRRAVFPYCQQKGVEVCEGNPMAFRRAVTSPVEEHTGFEPAIPAWKAGVLPLTPMLRMTAGAPHSRRVGLSPRSARIRY